jgi:hypothetical protein
LLYAFGFPGQYLLCSGLMWILFFPCANSQNFSFSAHVFVSVESCENAYKFLQKYYFQWPAFLRGLILCLWTTETKSVICTFNINENFLFCLRFISENLDWFRRNSFSLNISLVCFHNNPNSFTHFRVQWSLKLIFMEQGRMVYMIQTLPGMIYKWILNLIFQAPLCTVCESHLTCATICIDLNEYCM